MLRFNLPRVFSVFCLLFSPLVFAYDCNNLSEFSWGGNMIQGSVYRSHDGAYECTTNWCSWVEPGGNNNYWNQAWDFLGECGDDEPVNSAPEVSVVTPWNMVVGESQVFQATATDADSDIVSWEMVIYLDTIDGLQSPEVIGSGTGDMLATVNINGNWTAQSNYSFSLVVRVTDSNGETTTVTEPFIVSETPDPTLSLGHPKVMLAGEVRKVSTTVFHPLNIPPAVPVSYESEGAISYGGSSSSSSGGSSIGYTIHREYEFQPQTDADITVTASAYGLEETGFIEVLPADGLPEIATDIPPSIAEGETVEITVSAKDKGGIDNFQVTLNGNDMLAAATISYIGGDTAENAYGIEATFSWTAQAGAHLLQVIASDNNDNTVDDLVEIEVGGDTDPEEPEASIDVGHGATAWVEDRFKITVSSHHSTRIAMPTFIVVHNDSGETVASSSSSLGGSSSSSSGATSGYSFVSEYWVTSDKVGAHTITATFDDAPSATSITSIEILDGASRTPALTITAPDSAEPGESVDIRASVEGFYHVESLQLYIGGQLIEPDQSSSSSVYQIANEYLWLADEGTHVLRAVAADENGTAVETTRSITVAGEPVEGSCQAAGIDLQTVNAYPNWPHNDWKGDPNNANTGDLMSHNGSVYRANWWTTTLPGSDGSWTWVCDL